MLPADTGPERWLEDQMDQLVECWVKILIADYHRKMKSDGEGAMASEEVEG